MTELPKLNGVYLVQLEKQSPPGEKAGDYYVLRKFNKKRGWHGGFRIDPERDLRKPRRDFLYNRVLLASVSTSALSNSDIGLSWQGLTEDLRP